MKSLFQNVTFYADKILKTLLKKLNQGIYPFAALKLISFSIRDIATDTI